ncbi:MAG: DinB family protein [Janthinobacterium lividum]
MTAVALPSPSQALLVALQREIRLTRPFLVRLPAAHFAWQPHAKSMTLGQLASHLADMLGNIEDTLATDSYDMVTAPAADRLATATSPAEVLARFDTNTDRAGAALAAATEAALAQVWTFSAGEQVIFSQPRAQIVRELLLDHLIHHRGQLSVYLRLLEVVVPGTYGPTADEPTFDFA